MPLPPPVAELASRQMDFRYQSTSWRFGGFEVDVFAVCVECDVVTPMHQQNLSTICAEGLREHAPGMTGRESLRSRSPRLAT